MLENITRWLLPLVMTFAVYGCASDTKSVADESDCNVYEINGNFKHRDLQSLSVINHQERIGQISLNDPIMSLETAVNLGLFARKNNIPIAIVGNNTCDDECPLPYLMAKRRYAKSDVEFPKYSDEEREWLKNNGERYFKTTYSKTQILELINYNFRDTELQIFEDQVQFIDRIRYNNWAPECENEQLQP